ncbi:C45 family autoproteolytic acyltransferase/hydolase [Micromonospora sp. NPDC048830]|uniref:C45 family autoproteolytic acyltransferase/hydolase n=1 Tax=Micromonospora sp. NPDC048830 TaxID=3364257 RepID=UPI00372223DC
MTDSVAQDFPLYEISGPPQDRGVDYGEQAADRIALAADLYRGALRHLNADTDEVAALAAAFIEQIEDFDADQAAEIRGISHGARVPLIDVVLINARRELLSMAGRLVQPTEADGDECTAAAVLPEASTTGALFHGQNWDTSPDHARHSLVLRIRQDDGPDVLTFTEAGAVARSGLNSAGIAITGNNLISDRDYRQSGVPLPLIRRKALATGTYALALSAVYATRKSGSNNMMVSAAEGEIVDIECAPDESFLLHPDDDGILTHGNHWESVPALCKLKDVGATDDPALAATPCTMFRSHRVRRKLRAMARSGGVSFERFREVFLDSFGAPYSVCRPPRPAAIGGGMSATAAAVVMSPGEGFMDVAPLPALGGRWTRYRVAGGDPEPVGDFGSAT